MPLLTTNKWITGKITGFSFILLLALIVVLTFHFNVLKFQPHYHINFGGTGDLKYFSNNQFGPEFGVKNFSLWVRCQWTRPMGKGFSISLPQTFRGSTILITFYLLNLQKRALLLDVRNYKDEILGFLSVTPDKKFQEYQIEIKLGEMQRRLLKINVGNAENRQKVDKLQIEKLEIFSEKGSSLPWRYNFQFLLAIFFSFCLILVSGFRLNHAIISSIGMAIFFTAIRFIDVLVYLKYIKSFLLSFPFILLAVLLIRIFSKKISIFSDESHRILLILFFMVFIVHFIGQFYLYHFHFDVQRRISYFRVLENEGIGEYVKQLSPSHSQLTTTGAEEGFMPYPPWYNLIALPFVKLGFETDFWLRMQFILITVFFPFTIYALVRRIGLARNEARWASFLSIFFMGFLDDLFFNAYDRMLAFLICIIFFIYWFGVLAHPEKIKMKKSILSGALLGVTFVLHPSIPIVLSLFMFVSCIFFFFNPRSKNKQLAGKICLIYCIALVISLILFYGPFIKDVLTKTIPSALTGVKNMEQNKSFDLSSIGSALIDTIYRVIRYHPILILPILIAGYLRIKSRYSAEKNRLIIDSIYIWLFVYVLLVFLRSLSILNNIFIWIPQQLFIYPLSAAALGAGVCRISNLKDKTNHQFYLKMKKAAFLSTVGLWASFNLFWYYAARIGMIPSAGYLPKWLKLFI